MTVTEFYRARWNEPDVEVFVTHDRGQRVNGFIDARRKRDGVWEARVHYTYRREDGSPDIRHDWFTFDQLDLVESIARTPPSA